jgi:hypothetical protein
MWRGRGRHHSAASFLGLSRVGRFRNRDRREPSISIGRHSRTRRQPTAPRLEAMDAVDEALCRAWSLTLLRDPSDAVDEALEELLPVSSRPGT